MKKILIMFFILFSVASISVLASYVFIPTDMPIYIRAIKPFLEKNEEVEILSLGKDWGDDSIWEPKFEVLHGNLYYRNNEGKLVSWNIKEHSSEEICDIGSTFWLNGNSVYFTFDNNIKKVDLSTKKEKIVVPNIEGRGSECVAVEKEKIFYHSKNKGDYNLYSYDMTSQKTEKYNLDYVSKDFLEVQSSNVIFGGWGYVLLYRMEDKKLKKIKLTYGYQSQHMAKTKSDMFLSISGHEEGDRLTKKNWGDNGVYRIDFEKMELVKISEDTYDWIFATSDKLYGVKQKLWGLYDTIEEIECQVVK